MPSGIWGVLHAHEIDAESGSSEADTAADPKPAESTPSRSGLSTGDAASPQATMSGENAAPLAIPDFGEVLQLDERLGSFVESQFSSLSGFGLSTSLLGRITAASVLLLIGLCLLKLNSFLAKRFDKNVASWRRRHKLADDRLHTLFVWQRWTGYTVGFASLLYSTEIVIGDGIVPSALAAATQSLVDNGAGVAVVILVVLVLWEGVSAGIERIAAREAIQGSARAQTLLPVVRNVVLFALLLMTALVVLSELGIEIMPILAGAGVVGIAIGFGAQTLVKDFLTGFTIIVEDLLQIGDVVRIGDRTGAVQQITLRKIELRALDGTVHTIPFSSIDIVDNLTKEYSYYLMDIGVAYKENTDAVVECLRSIDERLRADDEFTHKILEPLEVLGVDQFADSAVVIKARLKTRARDQWTVGREFNRRMKQAFDECGIEIPFPHRTLYLNAEAGQLTAVVDASSRVTSSSKSEAREAA